jgi:hypothetical protein
MYGDRVHGYKHLSAVLGGGEYIGDCVSQNDQGSTCVVGDDGMCMFSLVDFPL